MKIKNRLDGKNVVFGKIIEGIDVLNAMEALGTNSGKPRSAISISECGAIEEKETHGEKEHKIHHH